MNETAKVVRYTVIVTYPPNVKQKDMEEHMGELIDTLSRYGLGVDGYYEVDE